MYKTSFGYNWQFKTTITRREEISEVDLTIASEFCLDKPVSKERLSRAYSMFLGQWLLIPLRMRKEKFTL